MSESRRASAAASVSNLGPGYDVLGLCLDGPRDHVTVRLASHGEIRLVEMTGDGGKLPRDPALNCATVAAREVRDRFGDGKAGLEISLHKGLPLGSGLGSSAASAVAAAVATADLLCPQIPRLSLLDACREGERLATGSPHPDNVAPSLLGGLVACVPREGESVQIVQLAYPEGLAVVTVKPAISIATADARAALPKQVPMADAVSNLAQMAALVTGLAEGNYDLVSQALGDRLATPYRAPLIPGCMQVIEAATQAGAVGAGISGSGPTLFALAENKERASSAARAMVDAFARLGLEASSHISQVDRAGARLES